MAYPEDSLMKSHHLKVLGTLLAMHMLPSAWANSAEHQEVVALAEPCLAAISGFRSGHTSGIATTEAKLDELDNVISSFENAPSVDEEAALFCRNVQGDLLNYFGHYIRAAKVHQASAEKAAIIFGPSSDTTLTLWGNLAVSLLKIDRIDEAVTVLRQVAQARESYARTPLQHKLATSLSNLAMAESERSRFLTAMPIARRAYAMAKESFHADDTRMGHFLHNLALVVDRAGERREAQLLLRQALRLRTAPYDQAETLASLAASHFDVGDFDESIVRYEEASKFLSTSMPVSHPVHAQMARGWCLALQGGTNLAKAFDKCHEAVERYTALGPSQ
jgi:tetratricopeptide (TPR) repeat protein